jgi:hypothetical protein
MPWWTFLWIVIGLSGSLGPVIYYAWLRHSQRAAKQRHGRMLIGRAKHIDGATVSEIQEASVVRVRGEVKHLERELKAPLSGRPCVYWRVQASVQRWSEPRGRYRTRQAYWQDTVDHSEGVPFVLADATGQCAVDPTLGTAAIGTPKRLDVQRGQVMPSAMAVMLTDQQVTLDEIRGEVWRFEEQIVGVGQAVVVVGAGRRAQRSGVHGETSYRDSQASWIVLDGNELELLITDDKKLMKQGPQGVPTDLEPRERWQGRNVVAPEASLVPIDEYEASLKSKKKVAVMAVFGAIALGVTLVVGVPAILRAMKSKPAPVVTPEQLAALREVTQQYRVAAYRSDDAWRIALDDRESVVATEAACTPVMTLAKDEYIPVAVTNRHGGLPPQSPRTSAQLALLERIEPGFDKVTADHYEEELARARAARALPLDILFEIDGERTILYVYDHDAKRIVCKSEVDEKLPRPNELPPPLLGSLRAVANGN